MAKNLSDTVNTISVHDIQIFVLIFVLCFIYLFTMLKLHRLTYFDI